VVKVPITRTGEHGGLTPTPKGSAFVPHDIAHPIHGATAGPLAGLTVAVKDMYDLAGERTGGGNPRWLETHPPAGKNAEAVQRLLDAGASVIGKTVCDEFFFSVTGANAHYGTPVNPRAPGRLPGGSSAGSAAATAAGACDFAIGSDTGGSIRIPAALCGIYGIRPTHGRVDMSGAMPMAPTFDVAGWFAPGPGLLRNIGSVLLEGTGERAAIKRLLVAEDALAQADAEVAAQVRSFLKRASGLLPSPEPIDIAPDGFDAWRDCLRVIQGFEVWQHYGTFITTHRPDLGPGIRQRMAYAAGVTREDADAARRVLSASRASIRRTISPGTVLCLPTAPAIAPELSVSGKTLDTFRSRVMALTCTAGVAGLPQVTLPIGQVAGCPVGASLIGWAGADEALLDAVAMLGAWCGP
jgi:amidase